MHACTCACMYVCIYVYVYVCTCVHVCMYVYIYIYIYVCTCMYVCIYIYIYIYIHTSNVDDHIPRLSSLVKTCKVYIHPSIHMYMYTIHLHFALRSCTSGGRRPHTTIIITGQDMQSIHPSIHTLLTSILHEVVHLGGEETTYHDYHHWSRHAKHTYIHAYTTHLHFARGRAPRGGGDHIPDYHHWSRHAKQTYIHAYTTHLNFALRSCTSGGGDHIPRFPSLVNSNKLPYTLSPSRSRPPQCSRHL
jgi:hypothetical protein